MGMSRTLDARSWAGDNEDAYTDLSPTASEGMGVGMGDSGMLSLSEGTGGLSPTGTSSGGFGTGTGTGTGASSSDGLSLGLGSTGTNGMASSRMSSASYANAYWVALQACGMLHGLILVVMVAYAKRNDLEPHLPDALGLGGYFGIGAFGLLTVL